MNILAIESSARSASCAVLRNGELLCRADQATGLTHSRTLMPMVESMLQNAELTPQDMDVIAAAAGPGSFTGLRIGVAAAKGLAWALFRTRGGIWERNTPDRAISLEDLAEELKGEKRVPPRFPQLVVGDGAELCRDYLLSQGIACELAPRHLRLQSAVGVALAAWPKVQAGELCTAQSMRRNICVCPRRSGSGWRGNRDSGNRNRGGEL